MAFDVAGARKAGYSDREIIDHLASSRDFDVEGAIGAGYSLGEIANHMAGMDVDDTSLLGSIGEAARRIPGGLARGITSTLRVLDSLSPALMMTSWWKHSAVSTPQSEKRSATIQTTTTVM